MSESGFSDPLNSIAIIGMSGRFPGAPTLDLFWQNLCDGVESIAFFSDDDLRLAGVDPELLRDPHYVKARAVLDDIDRFDAGFFGYTPHEAAIIDPQHRLFLECAWAALEDAGYDAETYSGSIGLYGGGALNYYLLTNLLSNRGVIGLGGELQAQIGNDKDHLTTRVAYKLNLTGPSVTVQTACSTALVAVCMACQTLLAYQCDMVLAGGVSLGISDQAGYLYQEGGIGSPDGHCRAFDARGQGTVGGDGVGIVVLKRLEDALEDGDTIHAVIAGFGINNDGTAKAGYTAPSVQGQAQAIEAAHSFAGINPETITYVEAHGTATTLGDPIEIAALTQAFRAGTDKNGFCAIGSVKTNIGHLNTAAGVAGLIKAVLALKHKRIPPSLHFHQPNPAIDFAGSPFYVNTRLAAWRAGSTPRRAGVSSFGVGGTNAHVVLEEAPPVEPTSPSRPWQLLLLSAKTETALEQATDNLAAYLEQRPHAALADVAYTLQRGRRAFEQRRAILCRDVEHAGHLLASRDRSRVWTQRAAEQTPQIVFMFPGQGAQYLQMAAGIYQREPVFREHVDHCAALLQPQLGFDLRRIIYPAPEEAARAAEQIRRPGVALPALFVIEYALAQLWMAWGIQPAAMIGHSFGEYVAATLAGVFSLEDALALAVVRGRLMDQLAPGAMLSVALPAAVLQPQLAPDLSLAAINGPALCVVSGPVAAIAELEERLAPQSVDCRRLHAEAAPHSALVEPMLEPFTAFMRSLQLRPPQIPYLSNLTGSWISAEQATDPRYWARHLRETVRFAEGLQALLDNPDHILLEVGPGRTLATLAKLQDAPERIVLTSSRHPYDQTPDEACALAALAEIWLAGARVNWPGLYAHEQRRRIPLPTYPFERGRYWIDAIPGSTGAGTAPLRKKPDLADWFYLPSWKRSLRPQRDTAATASETWLVFADDAGIAARLMGRLRQRGQPVISVRAGREWARLDATTYTIAPDRPDDYRALLDALQAQGMPPTRIVHLWNVTATGASDDAHVSPQVAAFDSLLWLAQALGAQPARPLQIRIVSNAMQAVAGETALIPEKALLLGPCQVIPEEYPHISCQSIDVVPAANGAQALLIEQLLAELDGPIAEPVIAYRGRDRWVRSFEAARLEPNAGQRALRERGVYLITGGLGGMGLELAAYLARTVQARLVLVGRSPLPARESWTSRLDTHAPDDRTSARIRAVLALEALGSEVLLCSADISDPAQTQAVVDETLRRFGALHGVIHAAGVAGGGMIQLKTQADAEAVLAAKVAGTRALEAAIRNQTLDVLVLCSSLSSVIGGFGRVDYCAANAFLDAFAHAAPLPTRLVAINWDAWQSVGMAADAVQASESLDGAQLSAAIRPQEGVAVFERIMGEDSLAQILVSTRELTARASQLRRAAQDIAALDTIQPGVRHPRSREQAAYVAPRSELESRIAAVWQRVLGITQIGVDDNFFELGGHSLLAVQLVGQLQREIPAALSLQTLFVAPTVAALAAAIERDQQAADQTSAGVQQLPSPIPRSGDSGVAELSFAQQRLWFIDQLAPGISAYNMPVAVRLRGDLDQRALEQSLSALIRRHAILRTTFRLIEDQPRQVIAPADQHAAVALRLIDLRAVPTEQREAQAQQLATEEVRQPFDLAHGPLLRATLLHMDQNDQLLLLTLHHIVSDAWSIGILIRDLTALYAAFAEDQPPALAPLSYQYADFAQWQRQWLSGDVLKQQLGYWRQQLHPAGTRLQALELPTDYPRPAVATYNGANHLFHVPPRLSADLKALSRHEGVTLFMLLLAAFHTLLHRYSGQSDIAVSTAVANRGRAEFDDLIGCFINILVLRADLSGNPSFRALLQQVRETCQSAYLHQDLPFELLVEELAIERDLSRNPLSQVMFIVHNTPRQPIELPTLSISPVALSQRMSAEFDLTIHIWEHDGELNGQLTYNTDLFAPPTITRLVEHFQTLLAGIVAQQDRRVSDLPLLTEAARRQLLVDWNATHADYPTDRCLHELIAEQARRTPGAIAVTFERAQLTYAELNARANRLARDLRSLGVRPEARVAICMERSLELPIALLAVLKASAAYVPIDPSYPHERLQWMLADAQISAVLTQQRLRDRLPATGAQIVALDARIDPIAAEPDDHLDRAVSPDNIAYIIYTSGSTGQPKGVMVPHRGLVNYLSWCADAYGIAQGGGVPVHSSLGFDLTVTSLFAPLIVGQRVILLPEDQALDQLSAALHAGADLSLVKLTPAHVDLLNHVLPEQSLAACMRTVIIGGEALRAETIARWREHAPQTRLINEYGPTETVVGCCVYEVPPTGALAATVPIGRPVANTQLYILDAQLQPVPIGAIGELYIGGVQLARGYVNRPDLTAERFIPHPFSREMPGRRLYRSGDLARYRPDGLIEFLGRIDQQIKIRGFRVEPGEIEAVLAQHEAVREAAVVLHDDRLVAYVVENLEPRTKNPGAEPRTENQEQRNKEQGEKEIPPRLPQWERRVPSGRGGEGLLTNRGEGLRTFLAERLPDYMLPAAFVVLDALPLTPNGKLDRRALPTPARAEPTAAFVSPRTPSEQLLAGIWAEVLGLERVGVHDNFFEIGGHSLLAVQVVSRIRRALRADLTLRSVFQAPTIAGLAALLDDSLRAQASRDDLDDLDDDEEIPRLDRSGRSLDRLVAELEERPQEAIRSLLQQPLRPDASSAEEA